MFHGIIQKDNMEALIIFPYPDLYLNLRSLSRESQRHGICQSKLPCGPLAKTVK